MTHTKSGQAVIFIIFTITCILVSITENAFALPGNRVKNTDFCRQDDLETAIILTEDVSRTTHFVLHDPERLVVDIHDAFIPRINEAKIIRGNIVSGIRLHQNQKNVVRAVVDINENTSYQFQIIKEYLGASPSIKIQLSPDIITPVVPENTSPHSILAEPEASPGLETALLGEDLLNDIFEEPGIEEEPSDFSLSGLIQIRPSLQISEDDRVENNSSFRNRIVLEGKYKTEVTISVLSDYLYFGSENHSDDYEFSLHEAKWEKLEKRYGFSLGKQILRWGKTDQYSPIDTLNPEDFREFILPDYEDRKIPVWMANARLFFDNFTLEGVVIPFFEPSKLDYFNTNWSVFGHIKKELGASLPDPAQKAYIDDISVHETDPEDEAEFGIRLLTTIQEIDMGLSFHHMIEDTPYFKNFPIKNIQVSGDFSGENMAEVLGSAVFTNENIEVEYKRTKAAGLEFETTWADFGLRGEAVWKENESFLTSSLTSSRHPTFTYILGTDYTTAENTYFNVQFLHSHIYDFSQDLLYFDRDTFSLLGQLKIELMEDWLQGAFKYNIGLNNSSGYLSPYLEYTYITNLTFIAGAAFFYGDGDTWFGRFRDYDLVYLDVSYQF